VAIIDDIPEEVKTHRTDVFNHMHNEINRQLHDEALCAIDADFVSGRISYDEWLQRCRTRYEEMITHIRSGERIAARTR